MTWRRQPWFRSAIFLCAAIFVTASVSLWLNQKSITDDISMEWLRRFAFVSLVFMTICGITFAILARQSRQHRTGPSSISDTAAPASCNQHPSSPKGLP